MQQINQGHTLKAWTYPHDFNPHIYIEGTISTTGEKPIVKLIDLESPPIVPDDEETLALQFDIDVYDPNGKTPLTIEPFSKSRNFKTISKVKIYTGNGIIELTVETRQARKTDQGHTLKAFTMSRDLVKHLYIEGSIHTNGEKPIVELKPMIPPPIKPEKETLFLRFTIDVYDPSGEEELVIRKYSQEIEGEPISIIKIFAREGALILPVEARP